jgi:hypothetical protein
VTGLGQLHSAILIEIIPVHLLDHLIIIGVQPPLDPEATNARSMITHMVK